MEQTRRRRLYTILGTVVVGTLAAFAVSDPLPRHRQVPVIEDIDDGLVKPLMTADEAVHIAKEFQDTLLPDVVPFIYFIWNRTGDRKITQGVSLFLNSSFGSRFAQPRIINELANGHVLWFDLRQYASSEQDQAEFINVWRNLEFDPSFSQLVTKDEVKFAIRRGFDLPVVPAEVQKTLAKVIKGSVRKETKKVHIKQGWYRYPDNSGRRWKCPKEDDYEVELQFSSTDTVEIKRISTVIDLLDFDDFDVVRFNDPAIDQIAYLELQNKALNNAVIVSAEYAEMRLTRTIKDVVVDKEKDNGLFAAIWGGLYYESVNVRLAKDVIFNGKTAAEQGKTDLDAFLNDQGVLQLDSKEGFADLLDRLRSDQQLVVWDSGVTGKIRLVKLLNGTEALTGRSVVISLTQDVDDKNKDIAKNAFFNVGTITPDAIEIIYPLRNGMHGFALFNGAGVRQDRVPPGVAIDRTIPGHGTAELQPSRSCISCHGGDGSDGLKLVKNDLKGILGFYRHKHKVDGKRVPIGGPRTDIFLDLDLLDKGHGPNNQFDRLEGLYLGEPTLFLQRGRDDYSAAMLGGAKWEIKDLVDGMANPREPVDPKQPIAAPGAVPYVRMGSQRILALEDRYWYETIGASEALADWGIKCKIGSVHVFGSIVQPDNLPVGVVRPALVTFSALAEGQRVHRNEWALAQSYGSLAAKAYREQLRKEKQP